MNKELNVLSRDERGYGSNFFMKKPVEVGKEYDLQVTEISKKGEGVARVQGFVVFVAGAKKGETCKVKITRVANRFAVGEVARGEGQANAVEGGSTQEE